MRIAVFHGSAEQIIDRVAGFVARDRSECRSWVRMRTVTFVRKQ
jgi:hypothetical protein